MFLHRQIVIGLSKLQNWNRGDWRRLLPGVLLQMGGKDRVTAT